MDGAVEALKAALAADAKGRLRWRVLRALGVAPWEKRAKGLRDAELVRCAVHLLLDREPVQGAVDGGMNPAFDGARFEELRNHGRT